MVDAADGELTHQKRILDILKLMKEELLQLRGTASSFSNTASAVEYVAVSTQVCLDQIDVLLEESMYFFELSNCKQLMLSDNIHRIKQLEKELQEQRLQKP